MTIPSAPKHSFYCIQLDSWHTHELQISNSTKEKWNQCHQTHSMNICVQVCTLYPNFKESSNRNNSGHTVRRGLQSVRTGRGSDIRMLEYRRRCWMLSIVAGTSKTLHWVIWWSFFNILFWWRRETDMDHPLGDSWMTRVRWLFTTGRDPIFRKPMTGSVQKKNVVMRGFPEYEIFNPPRNGKSRVIFFLYFFTYPFPNLQSLSSYSR